MTSKPIILVVDDQPINVKLLQRKLEREQMEVLVAYNGKECLEVVAQTKPDVILLDVMMPELDGIRVCQQLKASNETRGIPIIFITAKSTREGKLEGLGAGAADYITKPIDLEETVARVKTQLRILEIHRQNIELQERLADARQAAAVGAITQGIAHNLNNLLGVVVGYLDLIRHASDNADMVMRSANLMDQAVQRMVNIVRQLSTVVTDERYSMHAIHVEALIAASIDRFREENEVTDEILVTHENPGTILETNSEVLETAIGKVLMNAVEAYPKDAIGTPVELVTRVVEGRMGATLEIAVLDRGTGIEEEVRHHVFEPFITTKTSVGRGMGLTVARHSLRNLAGDISLSDREGGGTVATMTHPLMSARRNLR